VKAIHKAGSDTEKVRYEQQFDLMWKGLLLRSQKWDKKFAVLLEEPFISICKLCMISL